jgi:PAN domain
MRRLGTVVLVTMSILGIVDTNHAARAQGSFEIDVDRSGSDYKSLQGVSTPDECKQVCARDDQCAAWSHVKAGVQDAQSRCWLKSVAPEPTASSCCVSGASWLPPKKSPQRSCLKNINCSACFPLIAQGR